MEGTEVCQAEDAILALLELLVAPKLPAKPGYGFTPSPADEEFMAKQMHAVVLLYNYYHRRQHPELEFLNFESFCKLAVIMKPNLVSYMKLTKLSNDTKLDDPETQLSLTEKRVVDACHVARCLDASKEAPAVNGTAVSRVAVLLVDSTKQNALLRFGSITEGVWSAVEKDVEVANLGQEKAGDSNPASKRKRIIKGPAKREGGGGGGGGEDGLKKAAALAVCEATGIRADGLSFLESHIAYSTSKENTAMRVYISQCTQGENSSSLCKVPIKDVMQSLQGSLFSKSSLQWTVSPVVEYFHLLPFARILADWMNTACNHRSSKGCQTVETSYQPEVVSLGSSTITKSLTRNDEGSTNLRALLQKDENLSPETAKQNDNSGSSMSGLADNSNGSHNMEVDSLPVVDSKNRGKIANAIKPASQKIQASVHKSSNDLIVSDKVETPNPLTTHEIAEGRGRNVVKRAENCNRMEVDALPVIDSQKEEVCANVANAIKPANQEIKGSVLKSSKSLIVSDKVEQPSTRFGKCFVPNFSSSKGCQTVETSCEPEVVSLGSSTITKSLKRNDEGSTNPRALLQKDENSSLETAKQNDNSGSSMSGLADNSNGSHNMEVDSLPVVDSKSRENRGKIANAIKPASQKIQTSVHKSSNDLIVSDKVEVPNPLMTHQIAEGRVRNVVKRAENCNKMEVDALPVIDSQKEEMCANVANDIIPANQEIKGSKSLIVSDKVEQPSIREITEDRCRDVVKSDQNCNISVNPDGMPAVDHLPLLEYRWNVPDIEKMLSILASKDKELSEAALKVLLRKRDKLSFQQRDIEDQIALYDKKIQTIMDGGGDMALKIESFLELCNDTSFLRTVTRKNQPSAPSNESAMLLGNGGDDIHAPSSSCEALDDVCYKNNWMLPTYRVESVNGGFVASVIVKGAKAEWSSTCGEGYDNPRDARESAAAQILEKICSNSSTTTSFEH